MHFTKYNTELKLLSERYPIILETFHQTRSIVSKKLFNSTVNKLTKSLDFSSENIDDVISWTYQYLKKRAEKIALKKVTTQKIKLSDSDLLYATQFFTDKYMVEYLVDNSFSFVSIEEIKERIDAKYGKRLKHYSKSERVRLISFMQDK